MSLQASVKHAALAVLGSVFGIRRQAQLSTREIRHFVLLQYQTALGAAVHATPLIEALRQAVPQCEITVCASGFALDVLRHHPGVTSLIETPHPTLHPLAAARALRRALPKANQYAVLFSTGDERTSIALATVMAGARSLVGFTLAPQLFVRPLVFDATQSQIANNLRILAALGHTCNSKLEPQVFFSPEDLAHANSLAARAANPGRPLAALVTQTNPAQRKSWRRERFLAVARDLTERHGMNLALVGSASERHKVQSLVDEIGCGALNMAGETTLTELAALLSLCRVGLTLDTGTMHVGRAVGLPMVIIAPAWSPPVEWLPVDDARFVILKNLDLPSAPADYVIDEVSVDDACAALDKLLRRAV